MSDGATHSRGEQQKNSKHACGDCGESLEESDLLEQALAHYLDEHPESELLNSIIDEMYITIRCDGCQDPFPSELRVSVTADGSGALTAESCCSRCQLNNPLNGIVEERIEPSEAIKRQICLETESYELDDSNVSPEWYDVYLNCPNPDCRQSIVVDLPQGRCDHCNARVSLTAHGELFADSEEADCNV